LHFEFGNPEGPKFLIGLSSTLAASGKTPDIMSFSSSTTKYKSDVANSPEYSYKESSFNLSPKAGYFVVNNLVLGLDLSIITWKESGSSSEYKYTDKTSILGAGPFVRYYVSSGKVLPFLELGGLFGSVTSKSSGMGSSETDKSGISGFGGGAGFAAPLGDNVTFDVMIVYNSFTSKDKEDNPNNNRTSVGTFGIKLGFLVFPGKQKE
jgi:opacity protein-like surface antigen